MPSLSAGRKGGFMGIFLLGIVFVTSRGNNAPSPSSPCSRLIPLIPLFVVFEIWMARKVYKKVTGREGPRQSPNPASQNLGGKVL